MRKGLKTALFCIFGTALFLCLIAAAVMLGERSKVFAADASNTEDNKFEVSVNQYLKNGNFETGSTGLWGWVNGGNGEISTAEKHSGNNALKLTGTGNAASVRYYGDNPVFEAGKSYTLGAWVKFSGVSDKASLAYQYEADAAINGSGKYSGQRYVVNVTKDKEWTYYENTWTVTGTGGKITNIYFYNMGSSCDLYVDDIVLYEASTSQNLLSVNQSQCVRPGNGDTGAFISGWSNVGSARETAVEGFVGWGLNLFATDKNESWNYEWVNKLEKNTSYIFSFMYKISDNTGRFYAYYMNSNDTPKTQNFTGNGLSASNAVADTDWKLYSATFTTGDGELSGGTHRFGFVRGDLNSTIIASNFSIVKVTESTEETFPNGGIEKGSKGIPEGWMLMDNSDANVKLYQGEGYKGAGLVLTHNSGATQNTIHVDSAATKNVTVEAGAAYKITFKMKNVGSPVKVTAYLNGDGSYGYVARSNGDFYTSNSTTGWSDVTAYMVLDPNDTTVKNVRLRLRFTVNAGENVQILLDEFAMENVAFVKIIEGETVTRDYVKTGSEYALPLSGEEGKFVLYKTEDGTYYGGGEKIAASGNMNFTAERVSYAMENGAYIRVNDPAGIRFCTEIETSAITENVKVGVRLTRDNSSVPFFIEGKTYEEIESVRKYNYALVDIDEANYNTEFTATAYVEINGKKIYLKSSVTRSIAYTAYLVKNSEGYEANFTPEQKAVVEKYASHYTEA